MAKKESFADAYSGPDPASYYRRYAPTRLSIVEYAAALVRKAIDLGAASGPVIDLGCGYGTLGLLLRTELDLHSAYMAYLDGQSPVAPANAERSPAIVGVDRSEAAVLAAKDARFIDTGRTTDLNAPDLRDSEYGQDALVACTAVLGYVRPAALRSALDALRPRLAIVTCVTWLMPEFRRAFRDGYTVTKLNRVPLFQRWATPGEEDRMAGALIEGAHRAECLLLDGDPSCAAAMAQELDRVRARRATDAWLAAGRPGGCELPDR